MRVRFIKSITSIFGTFEPGMVIEMSNEKISASWIRNGIAHEVKGKAKGVVSQIAAKAPAKNRNTNAKNTRKKYSNKGENMRVRIIRMIATKLGGFNPGEIANVPKKIGQAWCAAGLACEDKSLDGAKETKEA